MSHKAELRAALGNALMPIIDAHVAEAVTEATAKVTEERDEWKHWYEELYAKYQRETGQS